MPSVNILSIQHVSAAERARIEAVDPGARLTDAGGWFDGEYRETWPAYSVARYLAPNSMGKGTRVERDGLLVARERSGYFVSAPAGYAFGPQNAFSITTNASGQIVAWDIVLYSGLYPTGGWIFTCNEGAACNTGLSQDGVNDWDLDYNADLGGGGVYGTYSQGSWVSSSVSTPEPSSLLLFAIGLLGLMVVAGRKQLAQTRKAVSTMS